MRSSPSGNGDGERWVQVVKGMLCRIVEIISKTAGTMKSQRCRAAFAFNGCANVHGNILRRKLDDHWNSSTHQNRFILLHVIMSHTSTCLMQLWTIFL
jgi:hypothetical protein